MLSVSDFSLLSKTESNRNNMLKDNKNHYFFERKKHLMFEYAPDLLTRKQAQELLSVGKNKILEFIHEGYLPAFMIGNSYRIKKCDLIEFVEKSCVYSML